MSTVNLIQTPIAVHNLHGPDHNIAHRHGSIIALLNAADGGLGGFNEFNKKDLPFIKAEAAKRGLNVSVVGLNGIVWDSKVYRIGKPRLKKIMQGGHVGADGTTAGPDNRRVGPSRFGLFYNVNVIKLGVDFELDATHLMARSFSVHKWRQKLFWRSVDSLADGVLLPDGVMFGDMNTNERVDLPGVADVNVPAPADMGKQHYTKIIRWGDQVLVSGVKGRNTPSDHNLLVGTITIYRNPQEKLVSKPTTTSVTKPVVSKLPKPGTAGVNWKQKGAPVAHPWQNRSARWKKRHKKLWSRILKWQTAYRRRL